MISYSFKERAPTWAKWVLYVALGIVAACIVLECALHITDPTDYNRFSNDPASGLVHYQENYSFTDAESCYTNTVVTNSEGLHAPEPPLTDKKQNEFRIVVAGSSFAEGIQVPLNETVSADLQDLLNAQSHRTYTYEVIPVAFSGNGTFLDILYYLRYGEMLQPNLVIDITTEYEYARNVPGVSHFDAQGNLIATLPKVETNPKTVFLKSLFRQSKLVMNLFNRSLILQGNVQNAAAGSSPSDPQYQAQEWDQEEQLMGAFAHIVANDHAKFLVASWSTPFADASTTQALPAHLAHAAATNDFFYTNMLPSISAQENATGVSASWSCDPHWSAAGDSYAAQAIFDYLQAHPTLMGR